MCSLVLATSCVFALLPAAGPVRPDERLTSYFRLLTAYRARPFDTATQLLTWTSADVEEVLREAQRWPKRPAPDRKGASGGATSGSWQAQQWPARLDEDGDGVPDGWTSRAEMVATAALAHLHAGRYGRTIPEVGAHLDAAAHWCGLGERLGDLVQARPAHARFVARVHAAASTVWLGVLAVDSATAASERARASDPVDPQVLLARGSALEARAMSEDGLEPASTPGGRRAAEPDLESAASAYEAVLARVPGSVEAAVRLARVLTHLGRLSDARSRIAPALATPGTGHPLYWGVMVAGEIEQAAGRPLDALERYRAAFRLCRGCQSAALAMSHALFEAGDSIGARAQLHTVVVQPPAARAPDPWIAYRGGQWHVIDRLLSELLPQVPR